jgi:hypothetical protein
MPTYQHAALQCQVSVPAAYAVVIGTFKIKHIQLRTQCGLIHPVHDGRQQNTITVDKWNIGLP